MHSFTYCPCLLVGFTLSSPICTLNEDVLCNIFACQITLTSWQASRREGNFASTVEQAAEGIASLLPSAYESSLQSSVHLLHLDKQPGLEWQTPCKLWCPC